MVCTLGRAVVDAHNANFEEPNMVQELIETYLRQPYDGEAGQFYTSANILTAITAYCGSRVAPIVLFSSSFSLI